MYNINNKIEIAKVNAIIKEASNEISKLSNNNDCLRYGNILTICEQVALVVLLPQILPLEETLVLMSFFLVSTKTALFISFGTKKDNSKKIGYFNHIINESIDEKKELTKERDNVNTKESNYLDNDYSCNTSIISNKKKIRILSNINKKL